MRLKLVLCASSLAAIVGAGLCIAALLAFFASVKLFAYPSLLLVSTFLLPTAAIVFASIFVYRHTSRRRKLQAFMTGILATILTITFLVIASILSARNEEPPAPTSPVAQNVQYALACRQGALSSTSFSNHVAGDY
jgi:purine-cytosine permease-like protein